VSDPATDSRRLIWLPRFELREVTTEGRDWPDLILVEKWEENLIRELRYVETRTYRMVEAERP